MFSTLMSVISQRLILSQLHSLCQNFLTSGPPFQEVLTLLIKWKNKSLDMPGWELPAALYLSLIQASTQFSRGTPDYVLSRRAKNCGGILIPVHTAKESEEGPEQKVGKQGAWDIALNVILLTFTWFQMSFCLPPHCKITKKVKVAFTGQSLACPQINR